MDETNKKHQNAGSHDATKAAMGNPHAPVTNAPHGKHMGTEKAGSIDGAKNVGPMKTEHEAATPKHEAAMPKHEAAMPKHEATTPKHEAAMPKHEATTSSKDGNKSK